MDSPTDAQILELAGRFYRGAGRREQAMRDELNLSAVQFWRRVVAILDAPTPEIALQYGPLLRRLERRRVEGMRQKRAG